MSSDGYPSDWNSRRRDVYSRDNHTCQNCGRKGGPRGNVELHAHHVVPKSKGGTHAKSNLITVCGDCHNAIHGNGPAPNTRLNSINGNSNEYFDKLGGLSDKAEELGILFAKYSNLISTWQGGNKGAFSQAKAVEQNLRKHCLETKIGIASFDPYAGPDMATNEFASMVNEYFSLYLDVIDDVVTLMDYINQSTEAVDSSDKIDCPRCGKKVSGSNTFCEDCGTELPSFIQCSECGSELNIDLNYCHNCGVEIGQLNEDVNQENELTEKIRNQADKTGDKFLEIGAYAHKLRAETTAIRPSSTVSRVGWKFCPNCGYEKSVYAFTKRSAGCVLCKATWEKKGIIFTKWKMTEGQYSTESKKDDEWGSLGEQMHDDNVYMDYLTKEVVEDVTWLNHRL